MEYRYVQTRDILNVIIRFAIYRHSIRSQNCHPAKVYQILPGKRSAKSILAYDLNL
ncbi:unnamed protein product [Coffea canephora]|uniref:Uncharacterized protein n=1 Tax=Coffea canephora TaxID=49390 RepID=A0A068UV84_COFCA|nr:unnamed protein product [Coffea canephora]